MAVVKGINCPKCGTVAEAVYNAVLIMQQNMHLRLDNMKKKVFKKPCSHSDGKACGLQHMPHMWPSILHT